MNLSKANMVIKDENLLNEVLPLMKAYSTDIVKLDHESDIRMFKSFINDDIDAVVDPPSDIIFANTVPIKDLQIQIDEKSLTGLIIKYRVIIHDELGDISEWDDEKRVGYLIIEVPLPGNYFICSLSVKKGYDYIYFDRAYMSKAITTDIPIVGLNGYMNTWYAIQIALLHPDIKEVFQRPMKVPVHNRRTKSVNKRKTQYIKVHRVDIDDIEKITHEKGTINRKCLVWYVIGHWREYKNGKKVFIQGYWKGKLRNIKMNIDERERVVCEGRTS